MIVSGHQSAYLPWLGYFHKLSLCDTFVYMDTVQYLENDWNNRNKIRTPEGSMWLTVPIDRKKTTSNMLDEIFIKGYQEPKTKQHWASQHWKSIQINYAKTPFFDLYQEELQALYLESDWEKLVDLCWAQFQFFTKALGIHDKKIVRMSEVDFSGKKDLLILDHCKQLGADAIVFGQHGADYVDLSVFNESKIKVYFQNYQSPTYPQRFKGFEPNMCILDLLFNKGPESFDVIQTGNLTKNDLLTNQHWVNQ